MWFLVPVTASMVGSLVAGAAVSHMLHEQRVRKKTGGEKDGSEPDNFDYWGVKFRIQKCNLSDGEKGGCHYGYYLMALAYYCSVTKGRWLVIMIDERCLWNII